MVHLAGLIRDVCQRAYRLFALLLAIAQFLRLCLRPSAALAAENLCLRTQLALYQERQVKPRHATDATRCILD
jgi:hypothetical protein